MTNKKEYMIILFLHLPPLVLTQSRVRTLPGAGRLFLIFRIQNCNNQKSNCQYNHKFLICTHNDHHLLQDSERVKARPPAAQVEHIMLSWCNKS